MLLLNRRRYMHSANDVIMTTATNPEVLAICYARGWCASADKMTKSEAEAVGSIGTAFRASNIVHFDEFKYFTNVIAVGYAPFSGCASLVSIDMSNVTAYNSAYTFGGCSALTNVVLDDGLTTLPLNMFQSCSSLVDIDLPSALTAIPAALFHNCTNLAIDAIPSGVTTIGAAAFHGVWGITEFTIPSSVTNISSDAFGFTRYVETLTCLATTAPTIAENTFIAMGLNVSGAKTLYVPSGASGYDSGYWLALQTTNGFTLQYI